MRTNGFLITAKIFVPVDPANLDDMAGKTAAIKAADEGDLSQLAGVGGKVLETSRKFTSKDLGDDANAPAAGDPEPQPEGGEPGTSTGDAPAEESRKRGRAAA